MDLGIGELITTPQAKDATHIAIVPVIAGEMLYPAQHVGLISIPGVQPYVVGGGAIVPVGLVDPYLKNRVMPGDEFWLFIYPGKYRALRHAWVSEAFPDLVAVANGTTLLCSTQPEVKKN